MPDLTTLYTGYNRASSFNPVSKRTLRKALKPYSIKMGKLRGMSDADLRRLAGRRVLKKHDVKLPRATTPSRPGPHRSKRPRSRTLQPRTLDRRRSVERDWSIY